MAGICARAIGQVNLRKKTVLQKQDYKFYYLLIILFVFGAISIWAAARTEQEVTKKS